MIDDSGMVGLFDGLVDDAGLFPPERLPMDAAVRRHRADEVAATRCSLTVSSARSAR